MTQVLLTIGFVLSLSVLTLAASFANVPPQITISARR